MKRIDLITTIERFGCVLVGHGRKHGRYRNPVTDMSQPVRRQREIEEGLAKHILQMLRNPVGGSPDVESTKESPK